MAVTPTHLTTGGTTTDATSFTTASITPSANALVLLAVINTLGSGTAPTPTVSGNGLTWVQVQSSGTSSRQLNVWRGMGASPTAGAITISTGATSTSSCLWSVIQYDGVDTSGTNGSGAIAQSFTATPAAATSTSQPFTTTPTAGNAVFGAVGLAVNNVATAGSGWTLGGATGVSSTAVGLLSEYDATDPLPTAVSASWTGSGNSFVIGVEVKAAPSSGTAATAAGALTLDGSGTAAAAATASGALSLSGTATGTGPATAAGSLTLGGSGTAQATATASGPLTLSGSGSATAPATASGALTLSGTATGGSGSGGGSVTVDTVAPGATGQYATNTTSTSWPHTCASGAALVVGVAINTDAPTTAVTYAGTSLTSLGKVHSNNSTSGYCELFYLSNPAAGTNTVAVTTSATVGSICAGSISLLNVGSVGTAVTGYNSGTGVSVNVTGTGSSHMIVDVACFGSTAAITSGETLRWWRSGNVDTAAGNGGQSTTASTSGPVTMSYSSATSDWWGIVAVEMRAAAGGTAASATGAITLSATGTARAAATGSGTLTLTGSATGQAPATASGALTLSGTGTASAAATASGSLTLGGSGTVTQPGSSASGSLTLSGTATASAAATASGSLTLGGTATAGAAATASGTLALAGAAQLSALANATGTLTLTGLATGTVGIPPRDITVTWGPLTARSLTGAVAIRALSGTTTGRQLTGQTTTRTLDGNATTRTLTGRLET
ncbi:MAG: beta strand repeat-containing protein [Blastococcus sp.]